MKDIFSRRAQAQFEEVRADFVSFLCETGKCPAVKEWDAECSAKTLVDRVLQWQGEMKEPLKKGSAKYAKAVSNIVGNASCYHAVAYRDVDAMHKSSSLFARFDFPELVTTLDERNKKLFWEYMQELSDVSYKGVREDVPHVPSNEEIKCDIHRRKGGGVRNEGDASLKQGIDIMWKQFMESRGETGTVENVAKLLFDFGAGVLNDESVVDACKRSAPAAQERLKSVIPCIGDAPFTEAQWTQLNKMLALATMEGNIPSEMMRGIENVASELAGSFKDGNVDLSSLNVESIGQRVLAGVSPDEIQHFANNLDKIIPAVQNLQ